MKFLASIVILISCFLLSVSQEPTGPKPDRWRGLILDESTPDDALKALGRPAKDKTTEGSQSVSRTIRFKNLEGISETQLIFQKDRLVVTIY